MKASMFTAKPVAYDKVERLPRTTIFVGVCLDLDFKFSINSQQG